MTKAKEVAPQIREKINSCKSDGDKARVASKMRSVAAEILALLISSGLAMVEHIRLACLHVHPSNRNGIGALPSDVHALLVRILTDGFVWNECSGKIWGFQPMPGADGRRQLDFNKRLTERANGLLAEPGDDVRCLTIAGTHTTQGGRCAQEETKGIPPDETAGKAVPPGKRIDIWDSAGNISRAKVEATNPAYVEFLQKGPEVTNIRWQVEKIIPELPSFLSEAANAGHGNERAASTIQQCLWLVCKFNETSEDLPENERWALVQGLLEGKPGFEGKEGKDKLDFVKRWSGGTTNPYILHEVEAWMQSLSFVTELPAAFLGQLGRLEGFTGKQDRPHPPAMLASRHFRGHGGEGGRGNFPRI